jgi:DNA adenine methylase
MVGQRPTELIEPFAGGAIVSLTVAAERLADHVTMVELDEAVAAVWQTIIHDEGGGEWLANEIATFELSIKTVKSALAQTDLTTREQAFLTILKNRVNRGASWLPEQV